MAKRENTGPRCVQLRRSREVRKRSRQRNRGDHGQLPHSQMWVFDSHRYVNPTVSLLLDLIRADRAGRGYGTEALQAFLPAYFERVPHASDGGIGADHIDGYVDVENKASQRVLEKCGFKLCESLPGEIENLVSAMCQLEQDLS